jgi:hypothetical protein
LIAVGTEGLFTPPLPRPPWAPWHRKISHSNQRKLSVMSVTFKIGVSRFAHMWHPIRRDLHSPVVAGLKSNFPFPSW